MKRMKKTGMFAYIRNTNSARFNQQWDQENPPLSNIEDTNDVINVSESGDVSVSEEGICIIEEDEESLQDDSDDEYLDDLGSNVFEESSQPFEVLLRLWALDAGIPHKHLSCLLKLLRRHCNFNLPADARTFLKTPTQVGKELATVCGGQMWYQGIENCLKHYYRNVTPEVDAFYLNLSMDGLPLHNSGPTQLWPILMQLHNVPDNPVMIVGIFCGPSKPTNCEDYLRPLVTELNNLKSAGVALNGQQFGLRVRAIIADTPARAFIKGVAYHNAIEGCIKCKCIGQHIRSAHKVIFEGINAELRTDAEFRSGAYTAHCRRSSPLIDLSYFDIIEDVVVGDRLHLIDLGIMKKLLKGWLNGTLAPYPKWGPQEPLEMSSLLSSVELPSEIHRKIRSFKFLGFWKGSELGTFLHYASIVVLRERLTNGAYHHFKLLFVAVTLLSSAAYEQYWVYAGGLLERFVEEFGTIYDRNHLTSNVHNLLHVCAEVCRFGPLPTISTYPFENKLQRIKGLVRNGWRTLEQVVGRLTELREIDVARSNQRPPFPKLRFKNDEAVLYVTANYFLKRGNRNSWFLTKNNTILKYFNAAESSGSVIVHGYPILIKQPQFSYPCSSELINCFVANRTDLATTLSTVQVSEIKCKLVVVEEVSPEKSVIYFTPLLHTLTE